jgi:galacturonokinase
MESHYGVPPAQVRFVRAPYRICPLGAHIDHQLGTVTAMAIDRGVLLAYAPSGSAAVRLCSRSYPGEVCFSLDDIPPPQASDWGNYARGAVQALSRGRSLRQGLVGVTSGDLAEGGLSSSAAIGLAYLLALEDINGLPCAAADNIRLDQTIENEYLGLNNGILDQSAILLSQRDRLTVIDCMAFAIEAACVSGVGQTFLSAGSGDFPVARPRGGLESPPHRQAGKPALRPHTRGLNTYAANGGEVERRAIQTIAPGAALPPFAILVAFSGVTQAIVATDYNRRVAECAEAARLLLEAVGRPGQPACLARVGADEYAAHRAQLTGAPAKRAAHFFSEMERVRQGIWAWEQGDLAAFGRLMRESGESSIHNYQCGSPPLIDLFAILNRTPGVYGARFSGAGFRGCCIALVEPDAARSALPELKRAYAACQPALAPRADFFLCRSADGARLI